MEAPTGRPGVHLSMSAFSFPKREKRRGRKEAKKRKKRLAYGWNGRVLLTLRQKKKRKERRKRSKRKEMLHTQAARTPIHYPRHAPRLRFPFVKKRKGRGRKRGGGGNLGHNQNVVLVNPNLTVKRKGKEERKETDARETTSDCAMAPGSIVEKRKKKRNDKEGAHPPTGHRPIHVLCPYLSKREEGRKKRKKRGRRKGAGLCGGQRV